MNATATTAFIGEPMTHSLATLSPAQLLLLLIDPTTLMLQLGPWLIGAMLECNFSGVLFGQITSYVHVFGNSDTFLIKSLVFALAISNFVQDLETYGITFIKFVTHFGDLLFFQKSFWIQWAQPATTSFICFIVQIFFAVRAWKCLDRSVPFAISISLLISAAFAVGVSTGVQTIYMDNVLNVLHVKKWVLSWLALTIAGDVVITFVLVRYLLSLGRDTEDTRSMIGRLIGLTMETMVPPLLCAIANLVVFVALPFSSWYIGLNAIQGKLYAFAIMHTLNSRSDLRQGHERKLNTIKLFPGPSTARSGSGSRSDPTNSTLPIQGAWTAMPKTPDSELEKQAFEREETPEPTWEPISFSPSHPSPHTHTHQLQPFPQTLPSHHDQSHPHHHNPQPSHSSSTRSAAGLPYVFQSSPAAMRMKPIRSQSSPSVHSHAASVSPGLGLDNAPPTTYVSPMDDFTPPRSRTSRPPSSHTYGRSTGAVALEPRSAADSFYGRPSAYPPPLPRTQTTSHRSSTNPPSPQCHPPPLAFSRPSVPHPVPRQLPPQSLSLNRHGRPLDP